MMKHARILWTDDEIDILRSHIIFLEERGYDILTASNADDALDLVRSETLDLIFLDEHMPGKSGLDILPLIKSISPGVPVIMITKSEEENIMEQAIGSQIDDYLIKPFAFEELLARLRALTRRNYQQKRCDITIGEIKIDLNKQQVYKNGELVILTPREYALLEYMAMRAGEVVTRTDIWEHVYEFNSSTTSNVVDVYIGYLRKKLEVKGKPMLIHTIRGRGYMLGAEK